MPCFRPKHALYRVVDGKKELRFISSEFYTAGRSRPFISTYDERDDFRRYMRLPCGKCRGCGAKKAREWAIRAYDEASLYDKNCFVTFTVSPKGMKELAKIGTYPEGSLDKRHYQLFMKRLREKSVRGIPYIDRNGDRQLYKTDKIRFIVAGEYGGLNGRMHYHFLFFNFNPPDLEAHKHKDGHISFISKALTKLWPYGFHDVQPFTFKTASYVARYTLKKFDNPYVPPEGFLPEFQEMSRNGGIGKAWFDKYGMTDCYPRDEKIVEGVTYKPPRYYDRLLERYDEDLYELVKDARRDQVQELSWKELQQMEEAFVLKMKKLKRKLSE